MLSPKMIISRHNKNKLRALVDDYISYLFDDVQATVKLEDQGVIGYLLKYAVDQTFDQVMTVLDGIDFVTIEPKTKPESHQMNFKDIHSFNDEASIFDDETSITVSYFEYSNPESNIELIEVAI
jgi:hypothetical protein